AASNVRLTIDSIPGLIWSARPDGGLDFVNQRAIDFAGGSWWVDTEGWGWLNLVHPDDVPGMMAKWTEHLASGEPYEFEVRLRGAGGAYRSFMTRAVPLRDETGRMLRWYGTSVDIQDRKEAEEAVKKSERQLQLVVETIPMMGWGAGADGQIDRGNRPALEYFGQTALEYSGHTIEELCRGYDSLIHPDEATEVMDKWRAALVTGKPFEAEYRVRRADGAYRWILARAAPLRDEEGN